MKTILIVDDTRTQIELITSILRQAGFNTIEASSSEDAKTKLTTHQPDAIVLDVVLPGISGFEFCRELKQSPNTSKIPVILCSTKGGEMDRFWGMKQGASSYIVKPVDPDELLRSVKLLVGA
jgi:two-component system, chemotaxis family, response regulator PixH